MAGINFEMTLDTMLDNDRGSSVSEDGVCIIEAVYIRDDDGSQMDGVCAARGTVRGV
jgi:hypothetical protein